MRACGRDRFGTGQGGENGGECCWWVHARTVLLVVLCGINRQLDWT
jgi:hypothetical protein